MELTFGRKLGLGFGAAGLVLVLVAFVGHRSTARLLEGQRWVLHTLQVRTEISRLLTLAVDAENGQRSYIVTGEEAYLEPFTRSVPALAPSLRHLRELTSDNPAQQRRLDALAPLLDARMARLAQVVEVRRKEGFEPAAALVRDGTGKGYMDSVRRSIADMDAAEEKLLAERSAEAEESADATKALILWSSALGALLVGLLGAYIARSLTNQVGSAARHIQSSSAELQAAANQQATGVKEQSTAMSEIATTISELLATSRQIAESAQRVAQIATQTAVASKSGDVTVGRGQDAVAGIKRQVDTIVQHMLDLGRKSQQIGSVLDIVSELAEQTNILAINATIEAAGAGEAGKRFGVVADEIRKLADRVARSTKEIRGLIDDVRSAVNTTVMTTEAGSKAVEAGARQFADVASAFSQITSQVGTTTDAAREIELSTKQQATAVEQVNVAIGNVAQAAKESEVSTGQTLQTAAELSHLARGLLRIVEAESRNGVARGR